MNSENPNIREVYATYTLANNLRNSKVACVLVSLLMPLGTVMDYFVCTSHEQYVYFLLLRLMSSVCALAVLFALRLPQLNQWQRRVCSAGWYIVPAFFICCMISAMGGTISTYYAGLNLVTLAISSVIQATLLESITAVSIIWLMYIAACILSPLKLESRLMYSMIFNNSFFLFCTAAIVITGNFFYNRLRFREFSLRHELSESQRQLEENNQKLKELDEIKNRFFANISHELRTPLTLLLSPLETMLHTRRNRFDAETLDLFSIMQSNGMRLLKLINDLLDLVRLESGRMDVKREPLELLSWVGGIMSAAKQMADIKKLKLETTVEPGIGPVMLDKDKLDKTFLNLVFNALKFTPAGGTVSLHVAKQGDQLMMRVQDTGVGIAEKNLPYVFDRFWQADDSSKRKYQGVGIGLSLVKELTEIQGGKVSVVSQMGAGTTFTVQLPIVKPEPGVIPAPNAPVQIVDVAAVSGGPEAPASKAEAPTVQSEEWLSNLYRRAELFPSLAPVVETVETNGAARVKNNERPTVLVADDEPDMLRFLKSQLVSHYEVIEATDGLQATEKAPEVLPDIILLDMNMPEKDGLQVCRELRQLASTQNIPIIILTARADEATKIASLSAGANDFLSKPFSTSELHVRVRNLVESHQYRERLASQKETLEKTIDQLKETETLLVQTEKMASLGKMSAGIIHEINNPLNYATTGLYTLRNKSKFIATEQQDEYKEILLEVEEGIGRVKTIISDLKSFTHPDTEQRDNVDTRTIVEMALRFLSNEWKDKLEIEQKLPERLFISGNRNKLLQIFVNLFQNSIHALRHKEFVDEKPRLTIEGREENGRTIITVRDNGEGMDGDTLNKVFDPFFTTKDVGEGMGLGLTICYRIVQEYEGRITVQSERGKFCEFKLEFPSQATTAKAA